MLQGEDAKFGELLARLEACFPKQQGIYTLEQFKQVQDDVRRILLEEKVKSLLKKIVDRNPVLNYDGRRIKISSDGTYHGSHFELDGKEVRGVRSLVLKILANHLVAVETEIVDIGKAETR